MAYGKHSTTKGSTNGKRRAPRADVKKAAGKRRRSEGKQVTR